MAATVDVSKIHPVARLLHEIVNYPGHVARKSSPEYTKAHNRLVRTKDLPCLVCGVRNSTLKDKGKNPAGAKQLETHHHMVEWALANALDLQKFNERVVEHMRARPHHDPIYDQDFTHDQMLEWVDHHPDNLWVLCDVHHRHTSVGIHEITMPIWGPQDLVLDDFEYIPSAGTGPSLTAKKAMEFVPPSAKRKPEKKNGVKKRPAKKR